MTTRVQLDTDGRPVAWGDALSEAESEALPAPPESLGDPVWDAEAGAWVEHPEHADRQERDRLRRLAEVRRTIDALEAEIGNGNIPARAQNPNVDAVLSELEQERATLVSELG